MKRAGEVGKARVSLKSLDLPGRHHVVDVDVLDEGLQLRALLDLVLAHRLGHLCSVEATIGKSAGLRRGQNEQQRHESSSSITNSTIISQPSFPPPFWSTPSP